MFRISIGWLLFAFIADLFSLFFLAGQIGAWWAFAWVIFAMMLGAWIIFDAGDTLTTLGGVFMSPSDRLAAMKETPWLLLVGVLFFVPGVISDIVALLLWMPSWRQRLLRKKRATSDNQDEQTSTQGSGFAWQRNRHQQANRGDDGVIEGEWSEKNNASSWLDKRRE